MSRRASQLDTICAIATAVGEAAVAIVRISGPAAYDIARRLAPALPETPKPGRASVRQLLRDGVVLDEALILAFKSPWSFTGEDVVEIQCHGGLLNTRRVLDAVCDAGARMAEPGEFTRRAMLNGKLDLTQVEAIADVIHARSEASLQMAQRHLAGELRDRVYRWRETLLTLVVLVEAAIDFSLEEHVYSLPHEEIVARAAPVLAALREALAGFDAGRMRYDGVRVALIGRPNAGKSSLLNALLGTNRAIVTAVPGTTRDSIEETIELGGLAFRLADTAGLRDSSDTVETLGIARSRALADEADILVYVVDASSPDDLRTLRDEFGGRDGVVVWNKVDLPDAAPLPIGPSVVPTCLIRGEGVEGLRQALLNTVGRSGHNSAEDHVLIGRTRHRDAIRHAADALETAVTAARSALPHELVAIDLREALDALGELSGAVTSDDILNRIFAGFCVGK